MGLRDRVKRLEENPGFDPTFNAPLVLLCIRTTQPEAEGRAPGLYCDGRELVFEGDAPVIPPGAVGPHTRIITADSDPAAGRAA